MCLPCLIIIQSCYFDYRINKPFTYSRCVICVSCSVHVISAYYVRKGLWAFYLHYPQINGVSKPDHMEFNPFLLTVRLQALTNVQERLHSHSKRQHENKNVHGSCQGDQKDILHYLKVCDFYFACLTLSLHFPRLDMKVSENKRTSTYNKYKREEMQIKFAPIS